MLLSGLARVVRGRSSGVTRGDYGSHIVPLRFPLYAAA
jgi:hypothetical protein